MCVFAFKLSARAFVIVKGSFADTNQLANPINADKVSFNHPPGKIHYVMFLDS